MCTEISFVFFLSCVLRCWSLNNDIVYMFFFVWNKCLKPVDVYKLYLSYCNGYCIKDQDINSFKFSFYTNLKMLSFIHIGYF